MFSVPSAIASAVNAAASYVYSNETFQDITQLMKDGTLDLSHLMSEGESTKVLYVHPYRRIGLPGRC